MLGVRNFFTPIIMTVISYPIPEYQNPPIQPQFFVPSNFNIQAITLGQTTTVETTVENNFVVGQQVRFIIPPSFGTRELNNVSGIVISLTSTTIFVVQINSYNMNPFVLSSGSTLAQVLAIGNINSGGTNALSSQSYSTNIPGSFKNIS